MAAVCNINKVQTLNEFIKNCIIQVFLRLLNDKSFNKISITEICEKAGVARVSFYRNFENKEDVLVKHIEKIFFDNENEKYDLSEYEILYKRLEKTLRLSLNNKEFLTALYRDNLLHLLYDRLKFFTPAHIMDAGKLNYEIQPRFFAGASYGVISHWIEGGFAIPPEKLAKEFSELLYKFHITI